MMGNPGRRPRIAAWGLDTLALAGLAAAVLAVMWPLGLTNRLPAGIDAYTYFAPYWAYRMEALQAWRLPLWNPYLFLGVPFLANPQAAVLYPLHWPLSWLPSAGQALVWSALLHTWLAAAFTYALGRRAFGLSRPAALLAGVLFGLGGYTVGRAENINQLNALAWLPAMLWFYHEAARADLAWGLRLRLRWGIALAAAIALAILAGHTQSTFIDLAGLGLYACSRLALAAREREGRHMVGRLLLPLLALLPAVLLAAAQLLPALELNGLGLRTGGLSFRQAVSFSLRPRLLAQSLLPPFAGGLDRTFGSEGYAEFAGYLGVSALILAAIGLLSFEFSVLSSEFSAQNSKLRTQNSKLNTHNSKLPLLVLALAGFLLALGAYDPLYYLLWRFVPGFDLFRAPARWLALYSLGMAGLAGMGLDALLAGHAVRRPGMRGSALRSRAAAAVALLLLLALLAVQQYPRWTAVAGWALAAALTAGLWALGRRTAGAPQAAGSIRRGGPYHPPMGPRQPGAGQARPSEVETRRPYAVHARAGLIVLALAELWLGGRSLPFAQATAPAAVEGLRAAPAALLAATAGQPPAARDRFLSLSDIRFDPGDLAELRALESDRLPPVAVDRFVRAAKQMEVIAPNLSLLLGLPAVDGYDGGILPLARYLQIQSLFVRADAAAGSGTAGSAAPLTDGRLREQLHAIPPDRLLDLTGTRYVITDKQNDLWAGDVYYDLEGSVAVRPGEHVTLDLSGYPPFSATGAGIVSYLAGPGTPDGPVATITATAASGAQRSFSLAAPGDTAWSGETQPAASRTAARSWPGWLGSGNDWLAVKDFGGGDAGAVDALVPQTITIEVAAGVQAPLVVRGLSLVDRRTGAHESITLSPRSDRRRIYSGDVKIYERQDAPGRAWLVHGIRGEPDDAAALARLGDTDFDPRLEAVIAGRPAGITTLGETGAAHAGDRVTLLEGRPERMAFRTAGAQPAVLVMADAAYPGWHATVDGQPAALLTVDLMLRGVQLAAGEHEVVLTYAPRSWEVGLAVSLGAFAILLLGLLASGMPIVLSRGDVV